MKITCTCMNTNVACPKKFELLIQLTMDKNNEMINIKGIINIITILHYFNFFSRR